VGLPDGAGCVYARFEDFTDETNLHRYDFATRQHTRLTSLDGEHVLSFDVSPDGQWVVYERNKEAYVSGTEGAPRPELWLVPTAGGPARRLLVDGRAPVWAPAAQTG